MKLPKCIKQPVYFYWGVAVTVVALLFFTVFVRGITSDSQHVDVQQRPWRHSVQQATEVAGFENTNITFLQVSGFLSSTTYTDNSRSAPQVNASSPEQFARLVPENATVYSDITTGDCESYNAWGSPEGYTCMISENYYAFIENTAGLVSYSDTYGIDGYELVSYDDNGMVYAERTFDWRVQMRVFGLIMTIIFGLIAISLFRNSMKGKYRPRAYVYDNWD